MQAKLVRFPNDRISYRGRTGVRPPVPRQLRLGRARLRRLGRIVVKGRDAQPFTAFIQHQFQAADMTAVDLVVRNRLYIGETDRTLTARARPRHCTCNLGQERNPNKSFVDNGPTDSVSESPIAGYI